MASNMPSAPTGALPYGNWTPALFQPHSRSIGGIVAQVTIQEQSSDELHITDHPVEQGSPISDHAFKQPVQLQINAGWSVAGSYDLSAETGVYGLLLSWQSALIPFDVITGKRSYSNMLIERLIVTTDEKTEFALMAQIGCRQVIIVSTQTVQVDGMSQQTGDHATPENTAPEQNQGPQATTTPNAGTATQVAGATAVNDPTGASAADKGINLQAGGGATLSSGVGPF